jgi:hypothetical protein
MFANVLKSAVFREWFSRAFLTVVFAAIFFRQWQEYGRGGSPYQTGDWLINYNGGFVRRGLFGQVFLDLTGDAPAAIWILFGLQMSMYGGFLVFGYLMIKRNDFSWISIAIWLGPAALGFFAWDSGSPFRKEILSYLALVGLVIAREKISRITLNAILGASVAMFLLAVFSWEASVMFLPVIAYMLWSNPNFNNRVLQKISFLVPFILIAVAGSLASIAYHGDSTTSQKICDLLREKGYTSPTLCSGAIEAIGWPSSYPFSLVQSSYPLYFGFLLLVPLALAPVLYAIKKSIDPVWTLFVLASFIPLFVVVNDYGRWISMAVISLAFLTTTLKRLPEPKKGWFPYLSIAYLSLWGLPHWLDPNTAQWPWLGLLSSVIEIAQKALA